VVTRAAEADLRPVADIIIEEARRLEAEEHVCLHLVVVMPTHCHLLFTLRQGSTLESVMRRLKARSARRANEALRRTGSLWQAAFYDHRCRDPEETAGYHWYIRMNPVRWGLVEEWEQYPHTYVGPHPL
jgi:REP element-mobilizing transposase RayT